MRVLPRCPGFVQTAAGLCVFVTLLSGLAGPLHLHLPGSASLPALEAVDGDEDPACPRCASSRGTAALAAAEVGSAPSGPVVSPSASIQPARSQDAAPHPARGPPVSA